MSRLLFRLKRLWRLLATGMCFVLFGAGALLLSYVVLPLACVIYWRSPKRQRRCQFIVNRTFSLFVTLMQVFGVTRVDIEGKAKLQHDNGCVIVSNHPSLIDVVLLLSYLPHCNVVVKNKISQHFLTAPIAKACGYIPNSAPAELAQEITRCLNSGNNLIIFPEGTRTTPGERPTCQRGAANIAIRTPAAMRVILIKASATGLTKQCKWYQIPVHRPHFRIEVKEKLDPNLFLQQANGLPSIAARNLTRHLEARFTEVTDVPLSNSVQPTPGQTTAQSNNTQ